MSGWPKFFRRRAKELNCRETRSLASDYVDEANDEATVQRLQAHLASCGPCTAFFSTFSKTVGLLKSMPKEAAPRELKDGIISRIREGGS